MFQVLAQKYGIGKSTVSDTLKKKATYLEQWENNTGSKKFRISYTCKFDKLNELVFEWFTKARAKNLPISGALIQEKAVSFSKELDISDFKASNGWLTKWKDRNSVKGFKLCGESAGVDLDTVEDYKVRLKDIVSGYKDEDIFNCDETGLYYRALSDKTLAVKGQGPSGTKVPKDRVTVLFACSATGEKLKPLVIGKADNPRCFKNVKRETLGVDYVANKKAWMTGIVFTEWLKGVNRRMRLQGRKILLFLDNAGSHVKDLNLSHVELKFLPPNTTSHLQPLDQGIIQNFKALYRKNLTRSLLSVIDSAESAQDLCKKVTLLDCIGWCTQSWRAVKPLTIQRCFKKAGFCAETDNEVSCEDDSDEDDDVPLSVLAEQLSLQAEELVQVDADLETEGSSGDWEKELVSSYKCASSVDLDDMSDSDSEQDAEQDCETVPAMTHRDVLEIVTKLKHFATSKDSSYLEIAQTLQTMTEKKIVKMKCGQKQTSIMSFFVKK